MGACVRLPGLKRDTFKWRFQTGDLRELQSLGLKTSCLVTGGDGNSFVCGIESLNDERFAAAGHYSE
jgi:hypothetical protein